MTRIAACLLLIAVVSILNATAKGSFRITPQLEHIYEEILSLRFEEAELLLEEAKHEDVDNLLILHIENYIDFLKVFIGEEESDLRRFEKNKDERLRRIVEGDPESPYYRFSQAEVILQWALARAKFDETIRAGWDINRAYKLLLQNQAEHPDFHLNKKSLSLIHALIGSVRGLKKGLIKVFTALDGTVSQGIDEIDELYRQDPGQHGIFHTEVLLIRAMMAFHIEDDLTLAKAVIDHPVLSQHPSDLIRFFRSTIAFRSGETRKGLAVLAEAAPSTSYPFYYLEFIRGREKLNLLDPAARDHLLRFVVQYRGKNYLKEAYQKLAWYSWVIENDEKAYHHWMDWSERMGQAVMGEDEAALREAQSGILPHKLLLKARLLFDGAEYRHSLQILSRIDLELLSEEEREEYAYRMARNLQMTDRWEEALNNYSRIIHRKNAGSSYFACNGALQVARILSTMGSCGQALQYVGICRRIKPRQHQKSLHQKALILKQRIDEGVAGCSL